MYVSSVNNNQPNFGHIYLSKGVNKITQEQSTLIRIIFEVLQESSPMFKNKSAEKFYKKKKE